MISKHALGMKRLFLNKKALSPAIAVALLLAITIALVAAVSYAATNATTTAEKAPQGVFNVQITKSFGFIMKQISGDAIYTGNLKLVIEADGVRTETIPGENNTLYGYGYGNTTGTAGQITVAVSLNNATDLSGKLVQAFNGTGWATATLVSGSQWVYEKYDENTRQSNYYNVINFTLPAGVSYYNFRVVNTATGLNGYVDANIDYGGAGSTLDAGEVLACVMYEYNSPWLQTGALPADDPTIRFGQYTITPGNVMKALDVWSPTDDIHGIISNWDTISAGDTVKVMLIYTPTNQVIWQGEVIVG